MTIKEKLLDEFENKVATFPIYDYLGGDITEQFKQFISQAIDQTREETIREMERNLPKKVIGANLDIDDIEKILQEEITDDDYQYTEKL